MSEDLLIVSLIEGFLGKPKTSVGIDSRKQWEFNCPSPKCKHDHNKFNLAYKSNDHIFKCWKCKYSGFVNKLVSDYGSKQDITRLKILLPEYKSGKINVFKKPKIDHDSVTCQLPDGYMPLSVERDSKLYRMALEYVTIDRKISIGQIDKFKIGYTESGSRKYRIILPSLNRRGLVNYYEARSYLKKTKMTYYKPDSPSVQDIIFNEFFINWNLPVYLVEGVFDSIRVPNSIPLLGKGLYPLILSRILENNCKVIVCLDGDAFTDSINIYNQLTSLGVDSYIIDLRNKKDVSKIFEDNGQNAVIEVLMTAKKMGEDFQILKLLNE